MSKYNIFSAAPIPSARSAVIRKKIGYNNQVMVDDPKLAAVLFARAEPFLPTNFLDWTPAGLCEWFRCYRYPKSQRFDWHFDGAFTGDNGESSKLTFMINLNEGSVGGETVFNLRRLGSVRDHDPMLRVFPRAGTALIFRHDVLHTGAMVLDGVNYVLRTDVMFRHQAFE